MIVAHIHEHHTRPEELGGRARASRLGGLDARAKIAGVMVFVVATALLTRTELILASLLISVSLAAVSAVPHRHLARMYLGALPFILIASVSVFLFAGVERGFDMWARTSSCVLALLTLAGSTETFELFTGLRRLKVPKLISTLLMLTYKYILILGDELERMKTARKARGFKGGRSLLDRYGLRVVSYTAGMVLVRSSGRADRAYEALRARGFRGDMPMSARSRIRASEVSFMLSLIAAGTILLVCQAGW
ncbi:MAG: energy-coupling factor transporter transmembrane component T family protein [Thermoplasmata archaeon]